MQYHVFKTAHHVGKAAATIIAAQLLCKPDSVLGLATGADKAEAVRQAIEGDVSPQWQASILRTHPDAIFLLDEAAASLLTPRGFAQKKSGCSPSDVVY